MIDANIGNRLRELRLKIGWSLSELADHIDMSLQQVQKYERGVNRISAAKLFTIAGIFNVPMSYFFGEIANTSHVTLNRIEADLLERFRNSSVQVQRQVFTILDAGTDKPAHSD